MRGAAALAITLASMLLVLDSANATILVVMSSKPEEVVVVDSPELLDVRGKALDILIGGLPEAVGAWAGDSAVAVLLTPDVDLLSAAVTLQHVDRLCFPHLSLRLSYTEAGPHVSSTFSLRMITLADGDTLSSLGEASAGSRRYESSNGESVEVIETLESACPGSVVWSMADAIKKLRAP